MTSTQGAWRCVVGAFLIMTGAGISAAHCRKADRTLLNGLVYDNTGSYRISYIAFCIFTLLATALLLLSDCMRRKMTIPQMKEQ